MDAQRPDVALGQQQSNQAGQQNAGNQSNVQELPFAISDDAKAKIDQLPEDVRANIYQALQDTHKEWNGKYTQIRQKEATELRDGRQATDQLKFLFQDNDFQQFMANKQSGVNTVQQQNQQQQTQNVDRFARFGDSAGSVKDFFEVLEAGMDDKFSARFDEIAQSISGLRDNFARTQQDKDWGALEEWAKEKGTPDPRDYEASIMMLIRQNPSLSLQKAYAASIPLENLTMRESVNQFPTDLTDGQNQQNQQNQEGASLGDKGQQSQVPPGGEPPGGNAGGVSFKSQVQPKTHKEMMDMVLQMRKDGKPPGESFISDGMVKVIEEFNANNGTQFDIKDF